MVCFRSILLFVTAVSALPTVSRRDTAETLANLQAIDSATRSLTATVSGWDGSALGALSINSDAQALGNQIDDANADAQDEPVASSADSQSIISFITGTLEPDIKASLNALVAKKAQFQADGLSSLVLSTLQSLQSKTNAYSTTLIRITSSDQKTNAQAVANTINADFNTAIQSFS